MTWPEVGKPLPRSESAYAPPEKWTGWILAEEEHGPQWRTVFGDVDRDQVWEAMTAQLQSALITNIRTPGSFGLTAEVAIRLTLNERTATVLTAWHYDYEGAAPRLATAYPTT
jgi:hypothetical protein